MNINMTTPNIFLIASFWVISGSTLLDIGAKTLKHIQKIKVVISEIILIIKGMNPKASFGN